MLRKTRNKILAVILSLIALALIIIIIRTIVVVNNSKGNVERDEIFKYLNNEYENVSIPSYSPVYGILNYSFDSINTSNTTMNFLYNSHMVYYSELDSIAIDKIYNDKVGMTKNEYENSDDFIVLPKSNCYYHQNELKDDLFNCDELCNGDKGELIKSITNNLKYVNVGETEINNFCLKDPKFPFDANKVYVDVFKLKSIFNEITGQEINFGDVVNENEYYKYGAYLVDNRPGLEENIVNISSIEVKSIKGNMITCNYTAATDNGNEINGTVKLEKYNGKYYIISNKNNMNIPLS